MHIESLKDRMVKMADTYGRDDGRVLEVSRIIDRLVVEDLKERLSA